MPTYRQLHEQSLKENQPARYAELKLSGRLSAYLDGGPTRGERAAEAGGPATGRAEPLQPGGVEEGAGGVGGVAGADREGAGVGRPSARPGEPEAIRGRAPPGASPEPELPRDQDRC